MSSFGAHSMNAGPGIAIFLAVHVIAMFLFSVGILFLLFWAFKTLTQWQLRSWGIGLVATGLILGLLTVALLPRSGSMMMRSQSMNREFDDTMPLDQAMPAGNMMYRNDSTDSMGSSMQQMSNDLQGKTGDNFDQAFLSEMIVHHQGAIDMANAALKDAKHDEVKKLAAGIIAAQQKEIDEMKTWEKTWGYTK